MVRAHRPLLVLVLLLWSGGPAVAGDFLTGRLLVATPQLEDPNFGRTVVYMVNHDADGALGLIINRPLGQGPIHVFLKGFGIDVPDGGRTLRLYQGGPVDPGQGFLLHTDDYAEDATRKLPSGLALTTTLKALEALARGDGPARSLFALGYAGWGPGQLESEIARGDWTDQPADAERVFDRDTGTLWDRARDREGVNL
ncbi:MAG: YqgE/AlgH family protein [Rhodobacterales bacterium]|nr:YqgE/AlgH family protein [Rhodobacterales bacterium]